MLGGIFPIMSGKQSEQKNSYSAQQLKRYWELIQPRLVVIDPSVVSTGVAWYQENRQYCNSIVQSYDRPQIEKLRYLKVGLHYLYQLKRHRMSGDKAIITIIESAAYTAISRSKSFISEARGVLLSVAIDYGDFVTLPISTWKKIFTQDGHASKDLIQSVATQLNLPFSNQDECDAVAMLHATRSMFVDWGAYSVSAAVNAYIDQLVAAAERLKA